MALTKVGKEGITGISNSSGATERMRLDASGNLLVGNSTFGAEDGVYISQGGNYVWARSDDTSGYFDRTGSDGKILELRKDGTGEQSRDMCYVDNTVQANILAMESLKTLSSTATIFAVESFTLVIVLSPHRLNNYMI